MPGNVQIFVRSLAGKTLSFYVELEESVECLKGRIAEVESIPVSCFRLQVRGRPIFGIQSLSTFEIEKGTQVIMAVQLSGLPVEPEPILKVNILVHQLWTGVKEYSIVLEDMQTATIGWLRRAFGEQHNLIVANGVICGHRTKKEDIDHEAWTSPPLPEYQTLASLNILNGDWLVIRPMTITEQMPT